MFGDYKLSDRYTAAEGSVYLTGVQALARIPIEQLRLDRANGLNTAGFVSGYPGSPLGGFDQELQRALATVDLPITHLPAVNEELGASAVMGSQLAAGRPDARFDGIVGVWYGKAPGMDRATDALRHGVFAGSSPLGGAVALVGDDPDAKSSTMPSSSDAALVDLHMPVLYPGTVAECLELGLHAVAMSRATGLWSALKVVTAVADGTGTVALPPLTKAPTLPETIIDGEPWRCSPSAQFLGPRMVAVEQEFHEIRSDLALRYIIDNELNRVPSDPDDAWLTIVSTGFTFVQVSEALSRLGMVDLEQVEAAGIRLLQLRVPIPFDAALVRHAVRGVEEVLVIEEKNPTLERLVRDALYDSDSRPRVVGKSTPTGERLLPSHGMLGADVIVGALRDRLGPVLGDRLTPPPPPPRDLIPLAVQRAPYFCSGCPHNWGTKVPDGAVVGMGTGCHGMTLLMDTERVGDSIGITAMGNEGAQWLGMAPFVETDHVFQNFGDGTYFHSGQLAVQAAIGAGANVTFKILYNHTVAMTGGQDASHQIEPPGLAAVLLEHGVKKVVITTDDPGAYRGRELPSGVRVTHRRNIVDVQTELAAIPGVTVLINDQGCAAEIRRARKRGLAETPKTRVAINHRICEGCGDCGDVSNCLSVQPIDTPLGRKTTIDQNSCNLDLSCLDGDCPAFMTVELDDGHTPAEPAAVPNLDDLAPIEDPELPDRSPVAVRLAGIGGTGVVTAAQILGTAAMLAGLEVDGVDQTGLSQKAGPVVSDVILTAGGGSRHSNVVGRGRADVVVAFDQLVAAADATVGVVGSGTVIFASTSTTPTGAQIVNPGLAGPSAADLAARFEGQGVGPDRINTVDTIALATALTGSATTANMLLLGATYQAGELPIPAQAIEQAIRLNGVAADANIAAFTWGRRWQADRADVEAVAKRSARPAVSFAPEPVPAGLASVLATLELGEHRPLVEGLAGDLVGYQDEAYATRYVALVGQAAAVGDARLVEAVARNFHKLLAYKDEYEVARLMLSGDGLAVLDQFQSAAGTKPDMTWRLHPPLLRALGMKQKLSFGPRTAPVIKALAAAKGLRRSRFDPFGRAELRRLERRLATDYELDVGAVLGSLSRSSGPQQASSEALELARELAALPDMVRGFEHLKMRRAADYEVRFGQVRSALRALGH